MSLHDLLPEAGVTDLVESWPDEPRVYERPVVPVAGAVDAGLLYEYVQTGCVPAQEIAVVKAPNPSLNARAFMTDRGRTDAGRLWALYEDRGHTVRLGDLQRVIPAVAHISHGIQQETGHSNYVHAFLTPPGSQGLRHHWDQQMAVIVQLAGAKRWQLWRPVVEAPMREHGESWRVWRPEYIPQWEAAGPDLEVDLVPGQSMLLPRGWVHNPFVPDGAEEASVHLTFALRERTPYWPAEKLLAGALEDPAFRRVLLPGSLGGPALVEELRAARRRLVEHVGRADVEALAGPIRQAVLTEVEYTT